jgi:hypothetical protein
MCKMIVDLYQNLSIETLQIMDLILEKYFKFKLLWFKKNKKIKFKIMSNDVQFLKMCILTKGTP